MKKVCLITCTYNRVKCVNRIVRMFLDQEYDGDVTHLIYNNSPHELIYPLDVLNSLPSNRKVIFINNHKQLSTGIPYSEVGNVGDIFRDAFTFIPDDIDIVTHFDDDDIFLPNHVKEGVKGMERAEKYGKQAYKPKASYFGYQGKVQLASNTLEPSIFMTYDWLKEHQYRQSVVDYNQGWEEPLRLKDSIFVDEYGIPTFLYDWMGQTGVFKISGSHNNRDNFDNHKAHSKDVGPFIHPISNLEAIGLYRLIENVK